MRRRASLDYFAPLSRPGAAEEPETFARVLRRILPVVQGVDAETADALMKLCEPGEEVAREVPEALAVALLL